MRNGYKHISSRGAAGRVTSRTRHNNTTDAGAVAKVNPTQSQLPDARRQRPKAQLPTSVQRGTSIANAQIFEPSFFLSGPVESHRTAQCRTEYCVPNTLCQHRRSARLHLRGVTSRTNTVPLAGSSGASYVCSFYDMAMWT